MAKQEATQGFADMVRQAQGMMAVNPLMAPQMEQFWKAQEGLLEESEAFLRAWYERRHEAANSAHEAVLKMNGNGADPAAAMQALTEWQRESAERVAEDLRQWVDMCARCAGRIASAETQAAKEGLEDAGKAAKSAAGTKQATPV